MKIITVQSVKLVPPYKLLYLHASNRFKLSLIDGSGHFSVTTNASQILQLSYIPGSREIIVNPLSEGFVKISVEDLSLNNGCSVSSIILVSDVHRMQLDQDTILEHGSTGTLQLNYFALTGEKFPLEQYKFIRPIMQKESKEIIKANDKESQYGHGIAIEQLQTSDDKPHLFTIITYQVGSYEVYAQKTLGGMEANVNRQSIFSNTVLIEVFQKLDVKPGKLLLVPGGSYTVKISGGPSEAILNGANFIYRRAGSLSRVFKILDPYIASVDPTTGEVTGLHVGQTFVQVTVTQETRVNNVGSYVDLCRRDVPVQVRLVMDTEILGVYGRTVLAGSAIRVLGALKYYNETFTFGVFPIEYTFISNHKNVFRVKVDKDKFGDEGFESQEKTVSESARSGQQGVVGYALKAGEAEIEMQIHIDYPEPYKKEVLDFTTRQVIKVVDPLYGKVHEFAEKPTKDITVALLPYDAVYKMVTNKDGKLALNYRLECSEASSRVLDIDSNDGTVTTSRDHSGGASIIIEENTLSPRLRTAYYIEVLPLYSMMVEYGYTVINMPLGSDVDLSLLLLDSFGRVFAHHLEKGALIEFDISHPKVIRAKLDYFNSTISLSAVGMGVSMLHVYHTEKERVILDLIKVHVSSIIEPAGPINIHLGGSIKFKTSVNGTQSPRAAWESENPKIISVDSRTGLGRALTEGSTVVHINDTLHLSTPVTVMKINKIRVDNATLPKYITNFAGSKEYREDYVLILRFFNDNTEIPYMKTDLLDNRVHFDCRSQTPDWVAAKAIEGEETSQSSGRYKGRPLCIVSTTPQSGSEAPPKEVKILLIAGSREDSTEYTTEVVISIPFFASFGLFELRDKEIILYKNVRTKTIKLFGSTDLRINTPDSSLIDVKTEMTPGDNYMLLIISVHSDITRSFTDAKVVIENTKTNQRATLLVSYDHDDWRNWEKEERKREAAEKKEGFSIIKFIWSAITVLFTIILIGLVIAMIVYYAIKTVKEKMREPEQIGFHRPSQTLQRVPMSHAGGTHFVTNLFRGKDF